eukprot:131798-Rhodomonas_salina.3
MLPAGEPPLAPPFAPNNSNGTHGTNGTNGTNGMTSFQMESPTPPINTPTVADVTGNNFAGIQDMIRLSPRDPPLAPALLKPVSPLSAKSMRKRHSLMHFVPGLLAIVFDFALRIAPPCACVLQGARARRNFRHPFFMRIPMGYGCLKTRSPVAFESGRQTGGSGTNTVSYTHLTLPTICSV